jgi:CTP synthase
VVETVKAPERTARVAVVGKYMTHQDAYKSIYEALAHAGIAHQAKVELIKVESEDLEKKDGLKVLDEANGILVPGGFGKRGTDGKIAAIRHARERRIPYLGICLGMQMAVVEFARNVCGLPDASSTELDKETKSPVIDLMTAQRDLAQMGGTMRLGAYPCALKAGTKAQAAYAQAEVSERHRHRYEFNNQFREVFEHRGMIFSGLSPDGRLVEIVELADHPWFVAGQFHPEFKSTPTKAHPLFRDFIGAALKFAKDRGAGGSAGAGAKAEEKKAPAQKT